MRQLVGLSLCCSSVFVNGHSLRQTRESGSTVTEIKDEHVLPLATSVRSPASARMRAYPSHYRFVPMISESKKKVSSSLYWKRLCRRSHLPGSGTLVLVPFPLFDTFGRQEPRFETCQFLVDALDLLEHLDDVLPPGLQREVRGTCTRR